MATLDCPWLAAFEPMAMLIPPLEVPPPPREGVVAACGREGSDAGGTHDRRRVPSDGGGVIVVGARTEADRDRALEVGPGIRADGDRVRAVGPRRRRRRIADRHVRRARSASVAQVEGLGRAARGVERDSEETSLACAQRSRHEGSF
jgi:hypothetical protein